MKKISIHDVLQNILKHKIAWPLILLTAMLGTTMILGISGAARGVKSCANDYYEKQVCRDASVTAELLLSPEDLETIRNTEGVKDAEAFWQTAAMTGEGEQEQKVLVVSVTERISRPLLREGRLPGEGTECAVETTLCEKMGWQIGDRILLRGEDGEVPAYLPAGEFVITGIADHPDHASRDASREDYVMVTPAAFDQAALEGCAMRAEILADKEAETDRFAIEYKDAAAAVCSRLMELAPERAALRETAVRGKMQKEIAQGQKQLDEAHKTLEISRTELDRKWTELEREAQELKTEEGKLPAAQEKLDAAKAVLEGKQKELEKTRAELDAKTKQLEEPAKQLEEARAKLDAEKKKLDAEKRELDELKDQLAGDKKKLAKRFASLEDEKAGIRSAIRKVIENAYGGSTGDLIDWSPKTEPDVNEEDVTAEEIRITGSYKAGTTKTWSQVIEGFVYSSAIPDEVLVQIYRNMKDDPHAEPDLKEVREFLSKQAIDNSSEVGDRYESLQPDCAKWTADHREYLTARGEYKKSLSSYQEKLKEYEASAAAQTAAEEEHKKAGTALEAEERKYTEAQKALEAEQKKYEADLAAYEQEARSIEEGKKALEESRAALNKEEDGYRREEAACEDGEKHLAAAEKRLKELPEGSWEVSDASQDTGLVNAGKESERLKGLAVVAALLAPMILAVVLYFAISRMILEQRAIVRNTRVTAEYKKEVWIGCLLFGISAVLAGMIIGILLAAFALEPAVLSGIASRCTYPMDRRTLNAGVTILTVLSEIVLAGTIISIACLRPLHKTGGRASGKAVQEKKTEAEEKIH